MATAAIAAASPPEQRSSDPLDTTVRLVTPERITFQFPLAGPFRRAVAYLIDIVIMAVLVWLGFFASVILSIGTGGAGLGLLFVFIFALMFGYGATFEGLFNGQTPGKKAMGLRVVSDEGIPITGTQAVLRNLLWGFDGILMGYIPAVTCMMMTGKFQRLGDLAAGTMVMVETSARRGVVTRVDDLEVKALLPWLPVRVEAGPELARALSDYVKHRGRFGKPRREEMASHLAGPLRRRYNLAEGTSADAVVCAFYHRVFLGD